MSAFDGCISLDGRAKLCRVPLAFRSDSLVSLLNQNPRPDFSANAKFGRACRRFEAVAE